MKTPAEAEALRAEFDRRAAAGAEARMYEQLRDAVADIPRLGRLWDELVANPPDLTVVLASATPAAAHPTPEPPLDTAKILALMTQAPQRLWSAEDVRVAIGAQSRRQVRSVLRGLVARGLFEEVQRRARHVFSASHRQPRPRTDTRSLSHSTAAASAGLGAHRVAVLRGAAPA